jgi:hypothetical protein
MSSVGLIGATPALASETIAYTYDAQGRLITVAHTGTVNNNVQTSYSFDAADNRTNVTILNAFNRVVVVPLNGLTVIPIPDP